MGLSHEIIFKMQASVTDTKFFLDSRILTENTEGDFVYYLYYSAVQSFKGSFNIQWSIAKAMTCDIAKLWVTKPFLRLP